MRSRCCVGTGLWTKVFIQRQNFLFVDRVKVLRGKPVRGRIVLGTKMKFTSLISMLVGVGAGDKKPCRVRYRMLFRVMSDGNNTVYLEGGDAGRGVSSSFLCPSCQKEVLVVCMVWLRVPHPGVRGISRRPHDLRRTFRVGAFADVCLRCYAFQLTAEVVSRVGFNFT